MLPQLVSTRIALIAEARFFRAFDYFMLVQTYGGVPLDMGSGELKFNTSPVRTSVRNTVPEVYTKAIFPDLLTAINDLPDAGRLTGTVTNVVARLFLSKAYLTYAWWLQNPNNIPTYPDSTPELTLMDMMPSIISKRLMMLQLQQLTIRVLSA